MKLSFWGAARGVTGANYLLEGKKVKILVDCGLIQGRHFFDKKNNEPFQYSPKEIDYLFVSHAHIDHVGRIPKLYKEGFRGKIICSLPSRDLAEISLEDGYRLLVKQIEKVGGKVFYEPTDIPGTLKLFQPIDYGRQVKVASLDFSYRILEAGHILGSAITEIWLDGQKIVFTGDLGNSPPPMIRPTVPVDEADYLVIESAYGDRNHPDVNERKLLLERTIEDIVSRKGVLMIPVTALEKTQELLFEMNELVENNRVPRLPIFIDSPLAIRITQVYQKYSDYFNDAARELIRSGDDIFKFPGLKFTLTKEESIAINNVPAPKIIIAGSGSGLGGRIIHHERQYLSDPKSTLLLIGFQVPGSYGRQVLDGAKTIDIHGEKVPVRAKCVTISGYSAHADQKQLSKFVANIKKPIKKVFVTQGEEKAADALARLIRDEIGVPALAPGIGETFEL